MNITICYTEKFANAAGGIETHSFAAEANPKYRVAFGEDTWSSGDSDSWCLQVSRWNGYVSKWEIKELLVNAPASNKDEYIAWLKGNVYEIVVDGAVFWQNSSFEWDREYGCWEPRCPEELSEDDPTAAFED